MMKSKRVVAALAAPVLCLAGGAAAQTNPQSLGDDPAYEAAMSAAWRQAAALAPLAWSGMTPEERQAFEADVAPPSVSPFAVLDGSPRMAAEDGALSAAEFGRNVSAVTGDLKSVGQRNERAAKTSPLQLRYGQPPRSDDQGYFFTYSQTYDYAHTPIAERNGVFPAAHYRDLRCRAAPRIGPFAQEPRWSEWSLRVCPDAQGRYRPAV